MSSEQMIENEMITTGVVVAFRDTPDGVTHYTSLSDFEENQHLFYDDAVKFSDGVWGYIRRQKDEENEIQSWVCSCCRYFYATKKEYDETPCCEECYNKME